MLTPNQLNTGATRVEQSQGEHFHPYQRPSARKTKHTNAEAGPSTLPPPRIPSVGPPTTQPPGEESETTADAEKNQPDREEDKVTVSNFYHPHIPRASDLSPASENKSGAGTQGPSKSS